MMAGWDGGEGMVPERRQEHVSYLYSLFLPGKAVY